MGQENTAPRKINGVEGAAGQVMESQGPEVVEQWAFAGGGLYGINVETLADDKTLTPGTDKIYQYLDEGNADRIITLATAGATAGDRFVIRHNGVSSDTHSLEVKQAAVSLDKIYAGGIKEFIFDGTNWISRGIGTGENDDKTENVAIGTEAYATDGGTAIGGRALGVGADGHLSGVAVGCGAGGATYGVAVGYRSEGTTYGVAIGSNAAGQNYGVAVGYNTGTYYHKYSIALGYESECKRDGETSVNINGDDSDQENNVVQGRWEGETADATPLEIFCAGQTNKRFTIRAESALAFRMTIVARDNVAGHAAMWTVVDGLIKRDGLDNTAIVTCTVVEVADESTDWGVAVTADDGNDSLKIEVTGDPDNPTQFAARMDGVETHF